MRLNHIQTQNYRSIDDLEIRNIGGFNVLIGKNNCGKSNILSAIDLFFQSMSQRNVVVDATAVRSPNDFHNRHANSKISITALFSLKKAERDRIVNNIVGEVPEMKNTVENLSPDLLLSATLSFLGGTAVIGYVENLSFVPNSANNTRSSKRTILDVTPQAAHSLYDRHHKIKQLSDLRDALISFMERFSEREYIRITSDSGRIDRGYLPYLGESSPLELRNIIRTALNNTTEFNEFQSLMNSHQTAFTDELAEIEEEQLPQTLSTITGNVTFVPTYVQDLIGFLGEYKVHHLKERRRDIGALEASQLLSLKVSRGGPDILKNIQETVESLLGVQVDAFAAEEQDNVRRRYPGEGQPAELDVDNFLVEANGAGIREALRIMLDFQFENPDILLIEEPEIHLHPALETSMMRYLRKIGETAQIIITTHSTNFLDISDIRNGNDILEKYRPWHQIKSDRPA